MAQESIEGVQQVALKKVSRPFDDQAPRYSEKGRNKFRTWAVGPGMENCKPERYDHRILKTAETFFVVESHTSFV